MFPLIEGLGDRPKALCPKCGGDATHVDEVAIENAAGSIVSVRADGEDGGCRIDTSVKSRRESPYEGRRHTISVFMSCELCGATSAISFHQHKGTTYVYTS